MKRLLRRLRRFAAPKLRPGPVILMYHRIASPPVDPWGLCVSPANLRSQARALRSKRTPLGMDAFVEGLQSGDLPANAVALTFDDGYIDNLVEAKQILEEEGVPATVLITSGWIGADRLFWWDELARLILLSRDEADLTLKIEDSDFVIRLPRALADDIRPGWRAWEPANSPREKAYFDLWTRLQRLDGEARDAIIATLADMIDAPPIPPGDLAMTAKDLKRLPSPMMTVGAHAITHQPLTSMSAEAQRREMGESRRVCSEITECSITGFAYPHGDADAQTRRIAREAGFTWACSTHSSAVSRNNYDLFDLPRIVAPNVAGSALLGHMRAQS